MQLILLLNQSLQDSQIQNKLIKVSLAKSILVFYFLIPVSFQSIYSKKLLPTYA